MRKKKGWTQSELAEKIGVTDKEISCWEPIKGYPDTLLPKLLGETLGISVNEILAGEVINQEQLRENLIVYLLKHCNHHGKV